MSSSGTPSPSRTPALARSTGPSVPRPSARRTNVLERIGRVYWYTMEFGVVQEPTGLKAYGAGLLSSFGELGSFEAQAKLVPFDLAQMSSRPYDPTTYQATLYVAPSFEHVRREVMRWLDEVTLS